MPSDLISVIVPVYNVEKYLDKCVASIVNQTYINLEIILVDDGSSDNCPKICDEWAKKDDRIKVIHKENSGVSSARNAGLDAAKGVYIAFVDSDDYIEKNMYELLANAYDNHEIIELSACGLLKNNTMISAGCNFSLLSESAFCMLFDIDGYPYFEGYVWNKLYRKDIIKTNGLYFDEKLKMCEDTLFNFNYLKYCKKIKVIRETCYNYILRNDSVMSLKPVQNDFDMIGLIDYFIENSVNKAAKEMTVKWAFKYWIQAIDDYLIYKNGKKYYDTSLARIKNNRKILMKYCTNVEKIFVFTLCYLKNLYSFYKILKYRNKR